MTVHGVVWAEVAIEEAIERLVGFRDDTGVPLLRRDEQAVLVAIDALRTVLGREAQDREWYVSYDVTARALVLQKSGEDEHQITSDEALALRDDLLAAVVAENEHKVLRGEGSDAECPSMGHCKERAIAGCKSCGTWVGP